MRHRFPALVVLAACCLLAHCARNLEPHDTSPAGGLPALPEQAAGWRANGQGQQYVADDLYLYINGGAVTWIECGFRQVVSREYTDGDIRRSTVEIYEMADAGAAQCIYHRRAGTGGHPLNLGDEGRLYEYYLEFRNGRFLVTITMLSASGEPGPGLADLAAAVNDQL